MDTNARLERLEQRVLSLTQHILEFKESVDENLFVISLALLSPKGCTLGDLTMAYERALILKGTRRDIERLAAGKGKS